MKKNISHGFAPRGGHKDPLIRKHHYAYLGMKRRCDNPNQAGWKNYGGRGIKVCKRWKEDYVTFKEDTYETYLEHVKLYGIKNTSLDRIDTDEDYSPENIRWATRDVQNKNRRYNLYFTLYGKTQCLKDWAREYGLPNITLWQRIKKQGMPFEKALTLVRHRGYAKKNK